MMPPRSIAATTALTVAFLVQTSVASACALCMDSLAYSTAPWLPFAFLVLLLWFVADWGTRLLTGEHLGEGLPSKQTLILVPILSIFIILFMGSGAFLSITTAYLVYRLGMRLRKSNRPLVTRTRLLAILTSLILIAVVGTGIVIRARMDTFSVYDQLVWSGTTQARRMSEALGSDPAFDIELLRPMIESDNLSRKNKAFEVLCERQRQSDLIRFADAMLDYLPETAPPVGRRYYIRSFWMWEWLERLGLKHIETRADLSAWLKQQDVNNAASEMQP